jgi:uncharacterized protein
MFLLLCLSVVFFYYQPRVYLPLYQHSPTPPDSTPTTITHHSEGFDRSVGGADGKKIMRPKKHNTKKMALTTTLSPNFTVNSATDALAGGVVLGLVVLTKMHANGNVLGISGIIGGLTKKAAFSAKDVGERICFTLGLLGGGYILATFVPSSLGRPMMELTALKATDVARLLCAGLLVGYGTARGSGCTR